MSSQWTNKSVVIMGLGLHGGGVGAARFFAQRGANVIVTDLQDANDLAPSIQALQEWNITYHLGEHHEKDFQNANCIIQNPAVPWESRFLQIARDNNVPIETDMTVFVDHVERNQVIGITGTKGKSTTAALTAHLLRETEKQKDRKTERRVELAGNIRRSVLDLVDNLTPETIVVLELSSWQLEGLARRQWSPHIAVVTSIFEDHLNRYDSFKDYVDAKRSIVRYQTNKDIAILPAGDDRARAFQNDTDARVMLIEPDTTLAGGVSIAGEHNILNATLALTAASATTGVGETTLREHLPSFQGLEGRLERIAERNGVIFINDTTATAPGATIKALQSFADRPVALIVGGDNKDLPYEALGKTVAKHPTLVSVTTIPGTATTIIEELLRKHGQSSIHTETLEQAVAAARKSVAESGGVVLFSPAATSFGQWSNEFERGDAFIATVEQLTTSP